jgi:hypothetical protein
LIQRQRDTTIDSLIVIIQRFADLVDQNSVLCREFVEAIKVVGDIIIKNILSEGEGYSNLLL